MCPTAVEFGAFFLEEQNIGSCFFQNYKYIMIIFSMLFKVEPIFDKGADQPATDEARILLVWS